MITIDQKSKQSIRSPLDIGNMSDRYKTTTNLFSFPSPSMWAIEKNLFYLLKNSIEKEFEPKYKMKPDYLSYDEYGTTGLAFLLMFVNNVVSLEDFNLDKVVIPSLSSIVEICKDKYPKRDSVDLETIDW